MSTVRETATTLGFLWTHGARVLKAKFHKLFLLFLVGWVGYYLTVLLAGTIAVTWSWAVIPLMAGGCLIQLTVTLAAYQMAIRASEKSMDAPSLPSLLLLALVTSLLVPFSAAFSSFGYFGQYAHDALVASTYMSGTLADSKFLINLNPFQSPITLAITLGVFTALWMSVVVIKQVTSKKQWPVLSIMRTFFSACMTFLVLFSLFHVFSAISFWWKTRRFMMWTDQGFEWITHRITLPQGIMVVWEWLVNNLWPLFWNTLTQPIVWLAVVGVVGGMQLMKIDTVWSSVRRRRGSHRDNAASTMVIHHAPDFLVGPLPGFLRIFHMFTVVLRSGVPFLAALIVSYSIIDLAGRWLTHGLTQAIGPVQHKYVMLVQPILTVIPMVVVAMCQAAILAVAYVRMRLLKVDLSAESVLTNLPLPSWDTATSPTASSTKKHPQISRRLSTVLVAVLAIALAGGLTYLRPGSTDPVHNIELGQSVTLMGESVSISNLQVGTSLNGTITGVYTEDSVDSVGVFVAVTVSVSGYSSGAVGVAARAHGVDYPGWHGYVSLTHSAGFTSLTDVVFEIPADGLGDLTVVIYPISADFTSLPRGVLHIPADTPVSEVIVVNETSIEEVSR
ncbi:MAG: hypothetical protein FWG15_03265 [Propionibacteriaceae bacterium]|nr:hypothetical protein [Propionibacteriaceae bacterium]